MLVSKTLMFAGTCPARGEITLVSDWISRPFQTRQITIRFPVGTLNLLALQIFLAGDDDAPTTGPPSGIDLLQDYGQVDYVRGDGYQIVLNHVVRVTAAALGSRCTATTMISTSTPSTWTSRSRSRVRRIDPWARTISHPCQIGAGQGFSRGVLLLDDCKGTFTLSRRRHRRR